jgi:hypothetical protein
MDDYIKARDAAGTPQGIIFAERLAALSPQDAAKEIADMFRLCADEDLASDIACDLQLDMVASLRIAKAIIRQRITSVP